MTEKATEIVSVTRKPLVATFADRYGIEPNKMMATLRATVIRPSSNGQEATNEQIASFLIVANQHALNPFTKEIHAFLGRQGSIVCVVGVDGWAKKMNEHPQFDGMDFEQDDEHCTCTIYRKDRSHPVVVTEYMVECRRETDPWRTHPKRMLRHKAMIQAARLAFSFAGIYDPDEAEAIVQNEEIDVTPKVSPVKLRKIVEGLLDAVKAEDGKALWAVWRELTQDEQLFVWDQLRSWERSAIKKLQDATKQYRLGDDLDAWAVGALKGCATPETLEEVWRTVQDAYAENDAEVPLDIQTFHSDRKAEFA